MLTRSKMWDWSEWSIIKHTVVYIPIPLLTLWECFRAGPLFFHLHSSGFAIGLGGFVLSALVISIWRSKCWGCWLLQQVMVPAGSRGLSPWRWGSADTDSVYRLKVLMADNLIAGLEWMVCEWTKDWRHGRGGILSTIQHVHWPWLVAVNRKCTLICSAFVCLVCFMFVDVPVDPLTL